ncbi:MAG: hypothetical protein LBH74_10215 [Nitrososphaerota archaeon]|jgi:hypothetical protein|nr:hypothetical protein [Nitrososphaerota archaeon]
MVGEYVVSIAAKLRGLSSSQLVAIVFYGFAGILLLISLPLTSFPPHLGFLSIISLITAYSLLSKRAWGPWLVFILLVTNTVFSLYTLYYVGLSNVLVALSMLTYAGLTWIVTAIVLIKIKREKSLTLVS